MDSAAKNIFFFLWTNYSFSFFLIFQKPNRISRKVYRQNFKDKVYLHRIFVYFLNHLLNMIIQLTKFFHLKTGVSTRVLAIEAHKTMRDFDESLFHRDEYE